MLTRSELRSTARARLRDSEALLLAGRYDGAVCTCGFAVEIALKARICATLRWPGFPSTPKEFENYRSLRTHDLAVLLRFSGSESRIKARYIDAWSEMTDWDPEARYRPSGQVNEQEARKKVACAAILVRGL